VITSAIHELEVDDIIWLETTGTLPTGLDADTNYYVVNNGITANTFQISSERRGEPIDTTGAGSGTHSFQKQNRASLKPFLENNR